jgi:hypothetical protein
MPIKVTMNGHSFNDSESQWHEIFTQSECYIRYKYNLHLLIPTTVQRRSESP